MPYDINAPDERDRAIAGILAEDAVPAPNFPESEGEPIENEDGSVTFALPAVATPEGDTKFDANLAEDLPESALTAIGMDLVDLFEKDLKSREKRDEQYEEGLRRTGLGEDAPGGAQFSGASRAVHPILAEGCVDFAARAIKELFPSNGPVKTKIRGKETEEVLAKARLKRDFLNWQLTEEIEELRAEKEQLLTQLPLGGSQYEKYWWDASLERICMEFVPVDKVILPYAATSFYTAQRVAHIQDITEATFEDRVASGFYREIAGIVTEPLPEDTKSQQANDKIEGREADCYNDDGLRRIIEFTVRYAVEGDAAAEGKPAPYIIHVDYSTSKILAVYRNWKEGDAKRKKVDWWVENVFIPWRGALGIGLPHLIGGLAATLTGALRALLDTAHLNNAPTMLKLKAGRISGQNTQIDITQISEVEGPPSIDDIRKVVMAMPFNPPSPVLFQLLDWITQQAKGVVATAEEKIADATSNTPVGTTLALIEQGSQVYSSIHARLHASALRALKIICRLNSEHPNIEAMQRFGVSPEVFDVLDDVEPVSDPNIFSEAQRYARWQSSFQLALQAKQAGVEIDLVELVRRGYELLREDGVDSFLPAKPKEVTSDPVTENTQAILGSPLKAVPQQDHIAHIQEHVRFMLDPLGGMSPLVQGQQLMPLLAHCGQHLMMMYQLVAEAAGKVAMAGGANPDKAIADAAAHTGDLLHQQLPQLPQMLQQAMQAVQGKMPPPPVDAAQATMQVAMAETQRRAERDKADIALEAQKLQADSAEGAHRLGLELEKFRTQQQDQMTMFMQELQSQFRDQQQRAKADSDSFLIEVMKLEQANKELQATLQKQVADQIAGMHEKIASTIGTTLGTFP